MIRGFGRWLTAPVEACFQRDDTLVRGLLAMYRGWFLVGLPITILGVWSLLVGQPIGLPVFALLGVALTITVVSLLWMWLWW